MKLRLFQDLRFQNCLQLEPLKGSLLKIKQEIEGKKVQK